MSGADSGCGRGTIPEGEGILDPESGLWIPPSLITSTVIARPLSLLVGWEGGSGQGDLSSETGLSGQGSQVPLREGERVLLALSLPLSAAHRAPREERQLQKATLCCFLATHHTTCPVA